MQRSHLVCERISSVNHYTKGITFSVKNGIRKGEGLDLGAEPPRMKHL